MRTKNRTIKTAKGQTGGNYTRKMSPEGQNASKENSLTLVDSHQSLSLL